MQCLWEVYFFNVINNQHFSKRIVQEEMTTPTPILSSARISISTPNVTPMLSPTPPLTYTPTPVIVENCKVLTYQDKFYYGLGKHCLDRITLQGVYFVAKNQTTGIKLYWKDNMLDIFTQTKNFYESQFENKIQIAMSAPTIIYGDRNIEEYDQSIIEQEIRQKLQIDSTNSFVILMFYPIQGENDKRVIGDWGSGGEVGNSSSAMNSWFWLDSEHLGTASTKMGADYSGYLGSAHEFGHALGIQHPYIEEVNKDSKGNIINQDYENDEMGSLMSYGGQKGPLIPNSFIRAQVKQKMMISN